MKKPFALEIPYQDAARSFRTHAGKDHACLLDSSRQDADQGRYSYILLDPIHMLKNGPDLFSEMKELLAQYKFDKRDDLPPFQGGLAGYLGYEVLHQLETVPKQGKDALSVDDCAIGFYDTVAAFDHIKQKAWTVTIGAPDKAHALADALKVTEETQPYSPCDLNWQSDFTPREYKNAVQEVIDYILAGDIFQANLTQRFTADLPEDFNRFGFYSNLRHINPAPFSAYLNFKGLSIACSSPERFLRLSDNAVETRPIKGTMPRSVDPDTDRQNSLTLKESEKDNAENTMIVDLLRNDLSRVCLPHSVKVPELCGLHTFASVHHLISTVIGDLKPKADAIDLIKATFPGGSITGAPKVRAMEIINELERCRRGPYCGSIGYIGANGEMDLNIVIRTVTFTNSKAAIQVGGGIVVDSNPEAEYQETLDKAEALFRAFKDVAS